MGVRLSALRLGAARETAFDALGKQPPDSVTVVCFGHHDLAKLRHLIAEHTHRAGMEPQRIAELIFLVNEAAYNAVENGGSRGARRMWCTGDHLVCEVTSPAVYPDGPFAGLMRRLTRRWSDSARTWSTARRLGRDSDGRRGGGAGWDWPG